jgi:hypothetical protein
VRSEGGAAVAAKVLVIGFFATNRAVLSGDEGTTGCCDARFDTLPGQVPQRVGGPAVHLYEHQARIEMQHLGFSTGALAVLISASVFPLSLAHQTFFLAILGNGDELNGVQVDVLRQCMTWADMNPLSCYGTNDGTKALAEMVARLGLPQLQKMIHTFVSGLILKKKLLAEDAVVVVLSAKHRGPAARSWAGCCRS